TTRTPGIYRQVDPKTRLERGKFLEDTNESVHSSVRVRLACEGLGLNDQSIWTCKALADWRLKRVTVARDVPMRTQVAASSIRSSWRSAGCGSTWETRVARLKIRTRGPCGRSRWGTTSGTCSTYQEAPRTC